MTELELMKRFGKNLEIVLINAGVTQSELAKSINMSQSTISYYIKGERMPGVKSLINICDALGCGIEELIDFDGRVE